MSRRRTRNRRTRPKRRSGGTGTPNKPTRSQIMEDSSRASARTVEKILNTPRYEDFVREIGIAVKDPKLRAILAGGLRDGELMDDMSHTSKIMRMGKNLSPIQYEIDLDKSLQWIGRNPENVPLILLGGTLDENHFGGNPIVTGAGDYIIDGHHRWSQVYFINPEARISCINISVENPKEALRKSQAAIGALTGEVPVAKVKPGNNVFRMSSAKIKETIPKHLSPEFYQAFYDTYPVRFSTQTDVHNHIYENIMHMRTQNPPRTDIGRELMPQYGTVGANRGVTALEKGEINIKPPYKLKPKSEVTNNE